MSDGLKVLVVDDEVPLTGVVGSYLEREGFAVSVAHTGPDAVDAARDDRPDLIVLPEVCDRYPAMNKEERFSYYRSRGDKIRDFFRDAARRNRSRPIRGIG